LGCLGTVLLLPGLCSLLFAMAFSGPGQETQAIWRDPSVHTLWVLGLLIGAGGIALFITLAIRAGK
jgi:hypothetical protein